MKLIVTIDTEEDNWSRYSATENPVTNIERIVSLQRLFDEFGVMPTYLVTYPVATNLRSVEILKRILDEGKCEIGMHCHPWNTPPLDENVVIRKQDTMLWNLPEDLVSQKLSVLHEAICKNFGVAPVSFRSGRWGLGPGVARSLSKLGYRVDTSITPYVDWSSHYGPDFTRFGPEPFRFNAEGVSHEDVNGSILEIPTTVCFLQPNFKFCHRLTTALENPFGRLLRLKGFLACIGLVSKVWLSPELANSESMIRLARRMEKNNYPCINMTFHSTSLLAGLSPFVKSREEEHVFIQNINEFLVTSRKSGWESLSLAQFESFYEVTASSRGLEVAGGLTEASLRQAR